MEGGGSESTSKDFAAGEDVSNAVSKGAAVGERDQVNTTKTAVRGSG